MGPTSLNHLHFLEIFLCRLTRQCQLPLLLTGVRVLELGQIAAGPFAASLLADLGADVVKIERPDGGDGMRQWPPLAPGNEAELPSVKILHQ